MTDLRDEEDPKYYLVRIKEIDLVEVEIEVYPGDDIETMLAKAKSQYESGRFVSGPNFVDTMSKDTWDIIDEDGKSVY